MGSLLVTRRLKPLKPGGNYLRVARFGPLHALKLQQAFGSNLTRVGTLVMPPSMKKVGVFVWYRGSDNNLHTLLQYPEGDQMACLVKGGIKSAGKNAYKDYLVFANEFADHLAEAIGRLNSDEIHTSIRSNLVAHLRVATLNATSSDFLA
jgi:hypothetical protein